MKKKYTQFIKSNTQQFTVIRNRLVKSYYLLILICVSLCYSQNMHGKYVNPRDTTNNSPAFSGITVREVPRSRFIKPSKEIIQLGGIHRNLFVEISVMNADSLYAGIVAPTISRITPSVQTRSKNTAAEPIIVTATGATNYQWWINTKNDKDGAVLIPGANSSSYTPADSSSIGTLYYYAVATNSAGSTDSSIVSVVTQNSIKTCYKPGATEGITLDSKMGITSLGRAGSNADNWPMVRKGAWLVLESKTKGFVVNGLAFNSLGRPSVIPASDFVEGMLVYDTTNKCLKMYTSSDGGATFGWYCITTQTCPD